ncbi:hypothetical protein EWM64_g10329 [Hericium alpestre]|uniref:Uncharacterized protein n=1 Tax=Hericium alpestre TaxID=135208 RepID=A0A4Y9ZIJ5_9AGAM|nr:hypothetical protein EWM64_g10329 [Hericium alpestre]
MWTRGYMGRKRDFWIDLELAGKRTVLLDTPKAYMCYRGVDRGYGLSFENGTTTPAPGCEGGIDHYRIVKNDLFGLNVVVRFEVDACIFPSDMELDSMTDPLDMLDVDSHTAASEDIRIIRAGFEVPQHSLIELKAIRSSRHIDFAAVFPQLYFSQIPLLYVGIHDNGTFCEVQIKNTLDVKMRRKNMEVHLRNLGQALKMIQELAIAHGTETHLSLGKLFAHGARQPVFQHAKLGFQPADPVYQRTDPTFQPAEPLPSALHSSQASLCGERHLAKLRPPIIGFTENAGGQSPSRWTRGLVSASSACRQQHAEIASEGPARRALRKMRTAPLMHETRYAGQTEERWAIRKALSQDPLDDGIGPRKAIVPANSVFRITTSREYGLQQHAE